MKSQSRSYDQVSEVTVSTKPLRGTMPLTKKYAFD